jgi:hypothetical protein
VGEARAARGRTWVGVGRAVGEECARSRRLCVAGVGVDRTLPHMPGRAASVGAGVVRRPAARFGSLVGVFVARRTGVPVGRWVGVLLIRRLGVPDKAGAWVLVGLGASVPVGGAWETAASRRACGEVGVAEGSGMLVLVGAGGMGKAIGHGAKVEVTGADGGKGMPFGVAVTVGVKVGVWAVVAVVVGVLVWDAVGVWVPVMIAVLVFDAVGVSVSEAVEVKV